MAARRPVERAQNGGGRAAAHHEDAYWWLLVDAGTQPLDPAVEPASAQFIEILRKVAIDRSGTAKFNLAGMGSRGSMVSTDREWLHRVGNRQFGLG